MSERSDVESLAGQLIAGLPDTLLIRQFYLGCLSQASYLVGDRTTGRAIAVDPRRDIAEMLTAAEADGMTIEMIVQTHFHADFVSGHLELAAATGASIAYGAAATTEFESRSLADGEVIDLGGVQIEAWSTPGHTPESISLVVGAGAAGEPVAVLTGDTLFIGDVGRPDLLVAADVPADVLAAKLYQSIQRLKGLPDATFVLPAHGAGSACGKALSTETVSTIGAQRTDNYALAPMTEQVFIELVTEGQPAAPAYFGYNAALNRRDRALLDETDPLPSLDIAEVDHAVDRGARIVDIRPTIDFAAGHLAGSIGIGLDGRFAEQAGSVLTADESIVLVGDDSADLAEARLRLGRIGFDRVVGGLSGVTAVLVNEPQRGRRLSRLTASQFEQRRSALGKRLQVIDVRNPGEVAAAPVAGARNVPLADLRQQLSTIDPELPVVLMCAGGARSAIASSVLLAAGLDDVSDVLGGANALGVAAACAIGVAEPDRP